MTARARRLVNGTGDYPLNDVSEYLVDRCPHVKCSRKVCDTVVFVNPSENRTKQPSPGPPGAPMRERGVTGTRLAAPCSCCM